MEKLMTKKQKAKKVKELAEVKSYIKARIREDKPIDNKKLKGFKIVTPL